MQSRRIFSVSTCRQGEGVQRTGWDGIVACGDGNACVPAGAFAREISADQDPAHQTQRGTTRDESRRNHVCVHYPAERAQARNAEGQSREVRAYDAQDLEQWLKVAAAVSTLLSELLGKRVAGLRSVDEWWSAFSYGRLSQQVMPEFPVGMLLWS